MNRYLEVFELPQLMWGFLKHDEVSIAWNLQSHQKVRESSICVVQELLNTVPRKNQPKKLYNTKVE